MAEENNSAMVGALMLVAGGIIGAGVALLFAPQSGKRTRRDICRIAKKTKHRAEEAVENFTDSLSNMVETVGDKASDLLDQGKDLAHDAKKEVLRAIEDSQEKLEKQRAKLAKMIS